MSLTTLKRKTDGSYNVSGGLHGKGYVNRISSGKPAFSLNDPRRVSAHTGDPSIQTRMRGTGYKGHGGHYGSFLINPVRSSYQNNYDPYDISRVSRPKYVCECPVVQQMTPLDDETKLQELDASTLLKETCEKKTNKSGSCVPKCYGTFVQKKQMDYEQYLRTKHTPLPRGKEHYPPMVSRNSTFTTVPNFSFFDFIQRLACK
jgi:hypothetical protein